MPNKGSPTVTLRFEPELLALLDAEIDRTSGRRKGPPYTRSTWMRQAVIDKLRHAARSRGADAADLADLDAFPETGV
jgi:hypothetical protein